MSTQALQQIIEEGRVFRKSFMSRRIKRGIEANALSGLPSGPVPLGYRLEIADGQRRAVIDQAVAPLVREAFHLAAEGEHSLRDLLQIMTERGLVSRNGKPMGVSAFWSLLTNPFYCGHIRFQNKNMLGKHSPIVTLEEYERAQNQMKARARSKKRRI